MKTEKPKTSNFDLNNVTLDVKRTSKPKEQTYANQFEKANLVLTYGSKEFSFENDKNGFDVEGNLVTVEGKVVSDRTNGTLTVTLKSNDNTKIFKIEGFKKIKPLSDITIFEPDTEVSSNLSDKDNSNTFPSSLSEQDLEASVLVDGQKPSADKFTVKVSEIKANDNDGTLMFKATVSFKDSDPLDQQKNKSQEIFITRMKTLDASDPLNKPIDRKEFEHLRFVFKDKSKDLKQVLPSEITNDMLDLEVGKTQTKDGKPETVWAPIDATLYKWTFTNIKIEDDAKGTLAKEVVISFKENPTVEGRTQKFDVILSGLKTSAEAKHDNRVDPADLAFDYAYEPNATTFLDENLKALHFNDFRSFENLNESKNTNDNKFANRMIEMYAKLYWDQFANLAWTQAIKNYEGIFRNIPESAQNPFFRAQSSNPEYANGQDAWLSHITKVMPLVVGWEKDPTNKNSVRYDKNPDGKEDVSKIKGMRNKEGPELYRDNHVIYVPRYDELKKEETEKLKAFVEAKKAYDQKKDDTDIKARYDAALEEVQKFLSIDPETFTFKDGEEYLKGYYKFNKALGENQRKPRLVLKSAVINKWNENKKPVLIYNSMGRFNTNVKAFIGKFTTFAATTPMLKYAMPFRLPVDNVYEIEQKSVDAQKQLTVVVSINDKYSLKAGDKIVLRASFKDEKNKTVKINNNSIISYEKVIDENNLKTRKFEFTLTLDNAAQQKDKIKKVQIASVSYDKKVDKGSDDKKWLYVFDEVDFGNKPTYDLTKVITNSSTDQSSSSSSSSPTTEAAPGSSSSGGSASSSGSPAPAATSPAGTASGSSNGGSGKSS
ncbi:lipoprotein 17-related variable surface protein [Ureaplasma diversum]|uniref:lipoprotein 17-related variable surface protein n=1 Tax=Ureaplasma diversum TaxID=42094 RepID=UPI001C9C9D01|nr:lipoprotein 17-related variable surface protein [Ureaplasma diversum]